MRPGEAFAARIGLPVRDLDLLEQALVHSSWHHEHRDAAVGHNERLEFLGDSVVNLAISEALYVRHPDDDEGYLSARRAAIVSTTGLARLAGRIDLGQALLLGEGEAQRSGRRRPSLLASTFEAVAGALYLDLGFEPVRDWLIAAGRPRAHRRGADRRAQESQEPAPGVHPASLGRSTLVPAARRDRAGPREVVPDRGLGRWRAAGGRRGPLAPDRRDGRRGTGARAAAPDRGLVGARRDRRLVRARRDRRVTLPDRSPAEPRLLALRLQGFKSFAERTNVEFGPGISAVVGPNGSGKSNLADALRWALGEQGRALRSRALGGRHLGRLGQARRPGHGGRHARARQRRRAPAGRLPGARARPPAVPLGRERLPPQQEPDPAARPGRPARRRAPRRQRLPVHRAGHGRPGPGPAPRGAATAVRGGRRGPPPRAPASPRRGTARRVRGEPGPGRRTSSASSGRRRGGWPPRPSSRRPGSPPRTSSRAPCCWRCTRAGTRLPHGWPSPRRIATRRATPPIGRWPRSWPQRPRRPRWPASSPSAPRSNASDARPMTRRRPPSARHRSATRASPRSSRRWNAIGAGCWRNGPRPRPSWPPDVARWRHRSRRAISTSRGCSPRLTASWPTPSPSSGRCAPRARHRARSWPPSGVPRRHARPRMRPPAGGWPRSSGAPMRRPPRRARRPRDERVSRPTSRRRAPG